MKLNKLKSCSHWQILCLSQPFPDQSHYYTLTILLSLSTRGSCIYSHKYKNSLILMYCILFRIRLCLCLMNCTHTKRQTYPLRCNVFVKCFGTVPCMTACLNSHHIASQLYSIYIYIYIQDASSEICLLMLWKLMKTVTITHYHHLCILQQEMLTINRKKYTSSRYKTLIIRMVERLSFTLGVGL